MALMALVAVLPTAEALWITRCGGPPGRLDDLVEEDHGL